MIIVFIYIFLNLSIQCSSVQPHHLKITVKLYHVPERCDLQQGCCIGLNEIVHVCAINWDEHYVMLIHYEIIKSRSREHRCDDLVMI